MKQTLFVYRKTEKQNGGIKFFSREVDSLKNDRFHELLGTVDLDIQPVKKEVVKESILSNSVPLSCTVSLPLTLPTGSYDAKLTYKIKE